LRGLPGHPRPAPAAAPRVRAAAGRAAALPRVAPRLPAVVRAAVGDRVAEDLLVVQRVHLELHVVERPADVAVEELPGLAAVLAAVHAGADLRQIRARGIDRLLLLLLRLRSRSRSGLA